MRILALVGKSIEEDALHRLLGHRVDAAVRYASVSRGVVRLEREDAAAVVLLPDPGDASWKRALRRIRDEFGHPVIVILPEGEDPDAALQAGAYEAYAMDEVTNRSLDRVLRHLEQRMGLEAELDSERAMTDWLERTGRFGSWEMDAEGRVTWSRGVYEIMGAASDQLTHDFTSVRPFIVDEDLEIYDQANKATFEQGWPLDFEYRVNDGRGAVRHLHLHRRVDLDDGGSVVRAYGMVRDVTAEREFEHFLFRRDAILQVVGAFAARFLRESDWESGIGKSLADLGKAADVTRTFIFRKEDGEDSEASMSMAHEWAAQGVAPLIDRPEVQGQTFSPTYDRWRAALTRRKVVAGHVRNFQTDERRFFEVTGTKSIMLVPVFVGIDWWGFIGFSEHREERDWLPTEIEALTLVADIFGSAILRRSMEDQLKEANRSAEAARHMALDASRAKSRFLANMSHEIRTPISGILGMAEMTITTGLTGEQREHIDMIRDAARSLLAIVNDVLDISKIEAHKMELKPVDFDFRKELETTIRPFGPQADAKGVVFQHRVSEAVPAHLHGDPDRLGQVLRNLIGNAMKFTERGLIELTVEAGEREGDRVCLRFTVRDTGEGIPVDKLETVFESFTQADSSVRKKHQGTGLGLTISRELVEMMGGTIEAESEPGRGSVFTFTAWFGLADVPVAEAAPQPVCAPKTLHLNLLLAEDNPLNQKFLTHFLSMFGHTVTVVENGADALAELDRQGRKIDLVLMDIQMPVMGGVEAAHAIRASDGKRYDPTLPIIALTAYAMKGDRERMIEAGMDDYVSKPVDMKALSAAIARCMAEKQAPAPAAAEAPRASRAVRDRVAADGRTVDLDMDSLVCRFEGNMELLKDILELFLMEAEEKLVNLDAGMKRRDPDILGPALHSITNISSHVLAMDIVRQSRELEKMCYLDKVDEAVAGAAELRPQFLALVRTVRSRAETL